MTSRVIRISERRPGWYSDGPKRLPKMGSPADSCSIAKGRNRKHPMRTTSRRLLMEGSAHTAGTRSRSMRCRFNLLIMTQSTPPIPSTFVPVKTNLEAFEVVPSDPTRNPVLESKYNRLSPCCATKTFHFLHVFFSFITLAPI